MRLHVLATAAAAALLIPSLSASAQSQVEILKQRKIDAFFKHVEGLKDLTADQKRKVLFFKEDATLGGEFGCIHQALLLISRDYKKVDALFLSERFEDALPVLNELTKSEDLYLKAYAHHRRGLANFNLERFEDAIDDFQVVLNDYHNRVGCDIEAAYFIATAYGLSRQKEKALTAAKTFLKDYPDAPLRFRRSIEQMINELEQDWESPLYDLSNRMKDVAGKIGKGETGDKTQGAQKEIVDILNELIKKAEQQEGNQGNGGNGGNNRGQPDGNTPSSPRNKSVLPGGTSQTGDLRGNRGKAGAKWGEMLKRERDEVTQAVKEKIPERYRKLFEKYTEAMAKGRRVTEPDEAGSDDDE